jgi:hypothetical protein
VSIDNLEQLLSILGAGKKLNNLLRERLRVDPEAKNTFHNFLYDLSESMGIRKPGPLSQFQRVWNDAAEFWKSQRLPE